ncbi:MAG: Gfo/Idh/MocA family protein [Candidatus Hodarchaeota archaeon]
MDEKKYSVIIIGIGKRGKQNAFYFQKNDLFKVVGLCDVNIDKCKAIEYSIGNPQIGTDAKKIIAALKPDIICLCTPPTIRFEMIKTAIENGAKLITMEKPIALTSDEGLKIFSLISQSNVKVVVSHQHRYSPHYQKVKELIKSRFIGRIHTIYCISQGWAAHMLSHLIDYSMWYNDYVKPEWVMAQAAGKCKLKDLHASPDQISSFVHFKNGVRCIYECGGGSPDVPDVDRWWGKNRISFMGNSGYIELFSENGWKAYNKEEFLKGFGSTNYEHDTSKYIDDIANWLEKDLIHECNFFNAFSGFEIMIGIYRSIITGGQITFPIKKGINEIEMLAKKLRNSKLFATLYEGKKIYS